MQQQSQPQSQPSTIVIEAWIHPLSALTPSLILHNLELQGIEVPQSLTIAIDRGHYDCTGTNYAVITVHAELLQPTQSFYCSFFSQPAQQGMDPAALHQCWLGNCYLHVGNGPACSFRHESGHAKTWRKMQDLHVQDQDQEDAVSVEPNCPSPRRAKSKDAKSKDKLRIIQLQKKNLVLRTELDLLKSEFRAMKEALETVKEDQVALAQRHKDQEAATKRANQCLQDWTNKQIIERVWTLETQHAYIRSEHLKQKEAQQQAHQKPNACKALKKKLKKELKQLSARLALLENENNNRCNKCCNNDQITNPFDFNAVYDHYDQCHYNDTDPTPEPMPALMAVPTNEATNEATNEGESDDDDFFEIRVEVVHPK
jgi:hypothetical protein